MAMWSSNEKDGSQDALHSEGPRRQGFRKRSRGICVRFWWLFLLILACIVLIIVLPIIYVAYPKMARSAANESTLNVTAMYIRDPTPDTIALSFDQVFYTNSSYHPTLYPFNASFYLPESQIPFASIETPQLTASNGSESTVPLQTVNITHMDEFTKYVLLSFASEEFTVALRGTGDLKEGGLPKTRVDWNKNITMKGFNRLADFSMQSFHVLNGTQADGTNAIGTASIFNPTVMTIDMGNVTLSMSVNGTAVGTATLPNLTLKPGNNTVDMRAEVYQLVVVGLVVHSYQTGILPVDVAGNTSTYNGVEIPYYNTMLAATKLQLDLNVFDAIKGSNLTQAMVL